jgi:hypothetical protein
MKTLNTILAGAAGLAVMMAATATPAAAQSYPNGSYGNNGNALGAVINSILGGGRYGAYGQGNDRVAVDQCARAAEARVSRDFRTTGYGNQRQGYDERGYDNRGYGNNYNAARVVGITGVERRNNGLRVSGIIDSGRNYHRGAYGQQGYGAPQGYPNQAYAAQGYGYGSPGYNPAQAADMRFSCRVDYRGYVRDVKISRDMAYGRRY